MAAVVAVRPCVVRAEQEPPLQVGRLVPRRLTLARVALVAVMQAAGLAQPALCCLSGLHKE